MAPILRSSDGTQVTLTKAEQDALNSALAQGGAIGSYVGGQLARLLVSNNAFANLATTSAFSTVGGLIGKEVFSRAVSSADLGSGIVAGDFVKNASGALGAYAGAEAGGALFRALGIDQTLGRIIGGTIGTAVTLTALEELAPTLDAELGVNLGLNVDATFIQNLGESLPSLGVAVFEQVTGFSPTVNAFNGNPQNVKIGSAVGGLIGTAVIPIPVANTVIGQFIGGLVGSLFGHESVGPNAGAAIGLNGNAQQDHNAWAVTYRGSDNNAPQDVIRAVNGLADAATALLNAEMDVLAGSSANVGASFGVGAYHGVQVRMFKNPNDGKLHFYDELTGTGNNDFPNQYARDFGSDPYTAYNNALNDAVMRQLALSTFTGGDPAMVNALRNSLLSYDPFYVNDALAGGIAQHETLGQLNYDLQAVQDYDLFQQNKVAFLTGFALREANADQADQQQAMQDAQNGHPTTFTPRDVAADLEQDLARGGLLQHGYY